MHAKEDFQKEKSSVTTTDDENGMQNQNETRIKSEGLFKFKMELKWWNAVSIILLHMSMLYFCYTFKWFEDVRTIIWMIIMGVIQGLGVTAGAHRFWTHRAYKAKWPLRIILLICYTSAGQIMRIIVGLNCTWSVNSVAHIWGSKPYDAYINPTENKFVAFVAFGEGWHNYHHVFPWDYKAAELGNYTFNFATMFIDICAKIGWVYDLKQPSEELVKTVIIKRGDRNHSLRQSVSDTSHLDSKID